MARYALLLRAAANRVYGQSMARLAASELSFLDRTLLGSTLSEPTPEQLGGVEYLTFEAAGGALDERDVAVVSLHSSAHALFERCDDLLRPITLTPRTMVDDDITTIQRYVGKTNEQFTKLLLNVTLAAGDRTFARMVDGDDVSVLDPLCGRGTTLNQAVVYGLDAFGIERDDKDFDAYVQFIGRWLKDQRFKHTTERAKLRKGRDQPVQTIAIRYGRDRKALDRRIEVFQDDTVNAAAHIKRRTIDLIVGDLPYGVQHENRSGGGRISRRPHELLAEALPAWNEVLRPGGAVGLAWNTNTLSRPAMFELLEGAGLQPCGAPDDDGFVHAVDRSITRDLVVATKPPEPRRPTG